MSTAWTTAYEIEWGDCDDAGIVFYPHFFRWMDTSFHRFLRARGTSHRKAIEEYGLIGLPIVEAHAEFRSAVSYDDTMTVSVRIADWQPRRFRIAYEGRKPDSSLVFEGYEIRACASRDAATGKLSGREVPAMLKAALS
jgi:YbgC/YbaW family acyl-CoA thioester hydrolase